MSARRNELTRTAARLFAEKGYHGTSIGDLAEAMGVQKGSLYAHIESKADLLWEVAREGSAAFHAALDSVPDEGPVVERIRAALRAHLRVVAEQLDVATVFVREWRYLEGERREEFVAERRRYEERFRALFREGRELGELRTDLDDATAALLALSAANWAYTWLRPGPAAEGGNFPAGRRRLGDGASTQRPTSSPTASRRCCSTACAGMRAGERRARRQSVRHPRQRGAARAGRAELARVAELDVVLTERPGHATELVTEAGRAGADAVVVFSGDGGFNEALNGLERGRADRLPARRRNERAAARARPARAIPSRRLARSPTRWRRAGRAGSRSAASTAAASRSPPGSGCPPRSSGGWMLLAVVETENGPAISPSWPPSCERSRPRAAGSSRSSRSRASGGRLRRSSRTAVPTRTRRTSRCRSCRRPTSSTASTSSLPCA